MKGSLGKSLNSNEGIRITNKMTTSLKTALDKLDLVPELDEKLAEENPIRNENNFNFMKNPRTRKFQKFKSVSDLEEINKFNFSIINNQKWGLESLNLKKSDSRKLNVQKPTRQTLAKELGKISYFYLIFIGLNIVNTKLPRSRILTISKNDK